MALPTLRTHWFHHRHLPDHAGHRHGRAHGHAGDFRSHRRPAVVPLGQHDHLCRRPRAGHSRSPRARASAPAGHVPADRQQLAGGVHLRRAAVPADPAHQLHRLVLRKHVRHHRHRFDRAQSSGRHVPRHPDVALVAALDRRHRLYRHGGGDSATAAHRWHAAVPDRVVGPFGKGHAPFAHGGAPDRGGLRRHHHSRQPGVLVGRDEPVRCDQPCDVGDFHRRVLHLRPVPGQVDATGGALGGDRHHDSRQPAVHPVRGDLARQPSGADQGSAGARFARHVAGDLAGARHLVLVDHPAALAGCVAACGAERDVGGDHHRFCAGGLQPVGQFLADAVLLSGLCRRLLGFDCGRDQDFPLPGRLHPAQGQP